VEFVVARGVLVYYARSDFRPERAIPSRAAERGEKTRKRNHTTRRGVRRDVSLSLSLSLSLLLLLSATSIPDFRTRVVP